MFIFILVLSANVSVLSALSALVVHLSGKSKAQARRLDALETRVAGLEQSSQRHEIEIGIIGAPDDDSQDPPSGAPAEVSDGFTSCFH